MKIGTIILLLLHGYYASVQRILQRFFFYLKKCNASIFLFFGGVPDLNGSTTKETLFLCIFPETMYWESKKEGNNTHVRT